MAVLCASFIKMSVRNSKAFTKHVLNIALPFLLASVLIIVIEGNYLCSWVKGRVVSVAMPNTKIARSRKRQQQAEENGDSASPSEPIIVEDDDVNAGVVPFTDREYSEEQKTLIPLKIKPKFAKYVKMQENGDDIDTETLLNVLKCHYRVDCPECPKTYAYSSTLLDHVITTHIYPKKLSSDSIYFYFKPELYKHPTKTTKISVRLPEYGGSLDLGTMLQEARLARKLHGYALMARGLQVAANGFRKYCAKDANADARDQILKGYRADIVKKMRKFRKEMKTLQDKRLGSETESTQENNTGVENVHDDNTEEMEPTGTKPRTDSNGTKENTRRRGRKRRNSGSSEESFFAGRHSSGPSDEGDIEENGAGQQMYHEWLEEQFGASAGQDPDETTNEGPEAAEIGDDTAEGMFALFQKQLFASSSNEEIQTPCGDSDQGNDAVPSQQPSRKRSRRSPAMSRSSDTDSDATPTQPNKEISKKRSSSSSSSSTSSSTSSSGESGSSCSNDGELGRKKK